MKSLSQVGLGGRVGNGDDEDEEYKENKESWPRCLPCLDKVRGHGFCGPLHIGGLLQLPKGAVVQKE